MKDDYFWPSSFRVHPSSLLQMITLTCTHCRATLEMDEAFAGGACRCQHCGTIQTVPSQLKRKAMSGGAANTKTLHVQPGRPVENPPPAPSSGLDELADIVASSGLTSRRLRHAEKPPVPEAKRKSLTVPIIVGAVVIVALLGIIIWLLARGSTSAPAKPQANIASPVVRQPGFCGVGLHVDSVVYVLDRGDSTRDLFGYLKEATYRSIESLGSDRKFQVVFWSNGSDDGYPLGGMVYATKDNIQSCKVALDEISAYGQTDITSAMTKAVSSNPDVIVIATGKASQLDDSFTQNVLKIRGDKPIKIDTFALGYAGTATALHDIASKTGGEFRIISSADLRTAGQ
jgi:hypothetical protein